MPLIDLHLTIAGLDEVTLEQVGIIANFFAGLLLAVEYFVAGERIDRLNDYLDYHTTKAYHRWLTMAKTFAKLNRKMLLFVISVVILLTLYQVMFYHNSSLWYYFTYYYDLIKPLLTPTRRILMVSLGMLSIMFIILLIAHSAPKRTLGAIGVLLYIVGNIMLFLHTISV